MKMNDNLSSNYVRIVYLKEMKSEPKYQQDEEPKVIKNSLAYLSSLIQEDNKKRIAQSTKVSIDWTPTQKQEISVEERERKRSKDKIMSSAIFEHERKNRQSVKEPRKLILNKIWNENGRERIPSIQIQKPKSKTIKMELQALPSRQRELQQSFIDFCNHLNHSSISGKNKVILKSKQQNDKIIYLNSKESVTPQKQKQKKRKSICSQSKTTNNKIYNKKSIVYRKNFKEINNFDWGKIAHGTYDMSHLKYI